MRKDERASINTEGCDGKRDTEARQRTCERRCQRPDREKARQEARGQTERKKAERPGGQSERNTDTQTLENTQSAIKKIYREKKRRFECEMCFVRTISL